eukprot:3015958-Prymnesium_polylepis.1
MRSSCVKRTFSSFHTPRNVFTDRVGRKTERGRARCPIRTSQHMSPRQWCACACAGLTPVLGVLTCV